MLPGPILRREMKAVAGGRHFVVRTLLATVLGGAAAAAGMSFLEVGGDLDRGVYQALAVRMYAVVVAGDRRLHPDRHAAVCRSR